MKKTYIIPAMDVTNIVATQMVATSITSIGGNSDLVFGDGDAPGSADAPANPFGDAIFEE